MAKRLRAGEAGHQEVVPVAIPVSAEMTVSNSSASVIRQWQAAPAAGARWRTWRPPAGTAAWRAPAGDTTVAWIRSVMAVASTASGNNAIHSTPGQRRWIGWMRPTRT